MYSEFFLFVCALLLYWWLFRCFFSHWVTPFWAVLPMTPSLLGKATRCFASISYRFHRMNPGYTTRHLLSHSRRINIVNSKHLLADCHDHVWNGNSQKTEKCIIWKFCNCWNSIPRDVGQRFSFLRPGTPLNVKINFADPHKQYWNSKLNFNI